MTTLSNTAYQALHRHLRKVSKFEPGVLRDRDVDAIHQMRVGLRRLRTALEVFIPYLVLPKTITVRRVKDLSGVLSPVRDLDVMAETLKTDYYPALPQTEQSQLSKLIKKISKQREIFLDRAIQILRGDRYQKLQLGLQEWLAQPQYQPAGEISVSTVSPDLLLPLLSKVLLHPAWQIAVQWITPQEPELIRVEQPGQLLQHEGERLHDLRKQIKRLRYQMELFTPLYSDSYAAQVQAWGELQDLLGSMHDGVVLGQFFQRQLGLELRKSSPELAALISQQQEEHWQAWRNVQVHYLTAPIRQELRHLILNPNLGNCFIATPDTLSLEPAPQPVNA
ncbi:CHAD domain-containing protein [Thermosynechococcaceae cyanobacterium BACA0444]|uniref:CHAD domain-containing protein n=1 Tax=Pseudocalidococcus azoricus BACA0444 TaxID=2918990 RepID=A0AAE4FT70_9CYAN|nr:CHAD domain-containing protein [Pseudocalidococcus azoricus]MDS3861858.1 CHAD domain-containing protein [Pseudocalidococcus azoricus BACA0444]